MDSDIEQSRTGTDDGGGPRPVDGIRFLGLVKGAGRRPRYLVRRPDGRDVDLPWVLYRTLRHVDGRRTAGELAERVRDDAPTDVVDGRAPDRSTVDVRTLDADRVGLLVDDRLRPAGLVEAEPDGTPAADDTATGRSPGRSRVALAAGVGVVAGLAVAGAVALGSDTEDTADTADTASPAPAGAVTGLSGVPTFQGTVLAVRDPRTAVVDVQGRPVTVEVIGLGPTDACAVPDATAFARARLAGQNVTLVPDPTLPAPSAEAPTWAAYLVLPDQQSYTDAALTSGWATAGDGRYRPGFLAGQRRAQDARAGMWGPPCKVPAT